MLSIVEKREKIYERTMAKLKERIAFVENEQKKLKSVKNLSGRLLDDICKMNFECDDTDVSYFLKEYWVYRYAPDIKTVQRELIMALATGDTDAVQNALRKYEAAARDSIDKLKEHADEFAEYNQKHLEREKYKKGKSVAVESEKSVQADTQADIDDNFGYDENGDVLI